MLIFALIYLIYKIFVLCYNIDMNRIIKIIIPIFILGLIFNTQSFVIGQYGEDFNEQIEELNEDIQSNKKRVKKIQEQQEKYSSEIEKARQEKASLSNQLAILDKRMAKAELDIESVETEIERTNLEIKKTNLSIENQILKIEDEKDDLASVLRLIYRQDRATTLEILLLNNTLAEFLNQVKYLEDLNEEIGDSLGLLEEHREQLEKEKTSLNAQNKELTQFKEKLEEKKAALEAEKEDNSYILSQINVSERQYQRMLAEAKEEQEAAAAEIASLEKLVRAKIAQADGKELAFNDKGIIWPISKNVITSYFHDPDYPFRYIFEHPGIDIRSAQGTPLKAAASGYVARAKYGGKGYSYIMIIHGDGLSTVYGHVSRINVAEDEYVIQGQTIGTTGGLPGTSGAGWLTTGPHLHFEVRLNGIPVDPLAYLP